MTSWSRNISAAVFSSCMAHTHHSYLSQHEEGAAEIRRQFAVRVESDDLGVVQSSARELHEDGGKRGRDEHGLTVHGKTTRDVVQLGRKAQLEQLVGLVIADVE